MERIGRRILFEGIINCRDLGGLQTEDGRVIREGMLLRSANLAGATVQDIRDLTEVLHLAKIVDLRNTVEQSELMDAEIPGAVHVDNPVLEEEQAGITHEKDQKPIYERYPPMAEMYSAFITKPDMAANISRAVRRILTHDYSEGPVLWHCFGGKDRCGMVAALVLDILGVPYETIREDYMMTNITAADTAKETYERILQRGGSEREARFMYEASIASEDYIDRGFKALDEHYGNAENFIREVAGAPDSEFTRFRECILE